MDRSPTTCPHCGQKHATGQRLAMHIAYECPVLRPVDTRTDDELEALAFTHLLTA